MENGDSKIPTQASWKKGLTLREKIKTPWFFQEVLHKAEVILRKFETEETEANRIAVVICAYNSKDILPETLRETTEQLRQSGLGGEIFVVLNNGGGDTMEFINSNLKQQRLKAIAREIGVSEIVFGKTESLSKPVPSSKSYPRKITLDKPIFQKMDGIRLVVIEQQNEPDNSGKIRGLRDIYEWLRQQNQETGYCPQYLLAIDAETRIRPVTNKKEIITERNAGLSHMVELSDGGKIMVGAKLQFTPYNKNGNPDWKEKTPLMQEAISVMHGMEGYEWLPGGGTLGGFPEMVSILSAISQKLPGTRLEDVLTTVIARALGIETVIDDRVIHANRCPREEEKEKVSRQMERWLKGFGGLEPIVGKPLAEKVINNRIVDIISYLLTKKVKGQKADLRRLVKGITEIIKTHALARGKDDYLGGEATWD